MVTYYGTQCTVFSTTTESIKKSRGGGGLVQLWLNCFVAQQQTNWNTKWLMNNNGQGLPCTLALMNRRSTLNLGPCTLACGYEWCNKVRNRAGNHKGNKGKGRNCRVQHRNDKEVGCGLQCESDREWVNSGGVVVQWWLGNWRGGLCGTGSEWNEHCFYQIIAPTRQFQPVNNNGDYSYLLHPTTNQGHSQRLRPSRTNPVQSMRF